MGLISWLIGWADWHEKIINITAKDLTSAQYITVRFGVEEVPLRKMTVTWTRYIICRLLPKKKKSLGPGPWGLGGRLRDSDNVPPTWIESSSTMAVRKSWVEAAIMVSHYCRRVVKFICNWYEHSFRNWMSRCMEVVLEWITDKISCPDWESCGWLVGETNKLISVQLLRKECCVE